MFKKLICKVFNLHYILLIACIVIGLIHIPQIKGIVSLALAVIIIARLNNGNKATSNKNTNENYVYKIVDFECHKTPQLEKIILPSSEYAKLNKLPVNWFNNDRFQIEPSYAYFKDGILYDVSPRNKSVSLDNDRYAAYNARFIISDGKKYDLYSPNDIMNIDIPDFSKESQYSNYVTRNLSYIIKMRATGEYTSALTIPLVFTAANLMMFSNIGWYKKDYLRLVSQLERIGQQELSEYLHSELNKRLPFMTDDKFLQKSSLERSINSAQLFGSDLISIDYIACACPICSKYQNRIYSLTGADKRFPKLPDFISHSSSLPCNCHHIFMPIPPMDHYTLDKYVYDNNGLLKTETVDAIEYSNRPFIDDRSNYEKQNYLKLIERSKKEQIFEEQNKERLRLYSQRRIEYEWICNNLPEYAPKSLGAYTRMKHTNTQKYQLLKTLALQKDYKLNDNI